MSAKRKPIQLISRNHLTTPPIEIMKMGRNGYSPTTHFYFYFRPWVPLWLARLVAKCVLTSTVQYIFTEYPATENRCSVQQEQTR